MCAFSERLKPPARHARLPQDCNDFVRLTQYLASHAFVLRKPQDYRKMTVRFMAGYPKNAAKGRTTTENRTMAHGCSARTVRHIVLSSDSLVLHDRFAAALHAT